jgi:transposase
MLKVIRVRIAGIDIGSDKVFVSVSGQKVMIFETYTDSFKALVVYLQSHSIESVAMEATGVYWYALYELLDSAGIEVYLVNGAHVKNLPGRKSDIQDCQWLEELHSYGLLRPSFIPDDLTRQLRTYTRLRDDHIGIGGMYINQMQKALTSMNIRLHQVISQITGVSGLRIIEAILAGQRDREALADLCTSQINNRKREEVIRSLEGSYKEEHLFVLGQALKAYQFAVTQRQACEVQIEALLDKVTKDLPPPDADKCKTLDKPKTPRHNTPQIEDLHLKLVTLAKGNDVAQISGLSDASFLKLMAEVGTDLSKWTTASHFVSWLGLSPKIESSSKKKKRKKRLSKPVAGQIFREAVQSIAKSKYLALGAFYRRIKARRGALVANVATARKLAIQFYNLMRYGYTFVEQGIELYQQKFEQKLFQHLQRTAQLFGFNLVPVDANL